MSKMSITFVEDDRREIAQVVATLDTSHYFDIHEFADYSALTEDVIRNTSLFVLDVLTGGGDKAFCQFIGVLRRREKAFLAFTRITEHGRLKSFPGQPELRQAVFEHGGLGVVSKVVPAGDETRVRRRDLQLELIERIMEFYWAWREHC